MPPDAAPTRATTEPARVHAGPRVVPVSRPDKVLFPDEGITKLELAQYYVAVADVMLPHLAGRPIALERFPDGLKGQRFYQKDVGPSAPEWLHRVSVRKRGGELTQIVCDDAATLVYLADQACITPHVWLSRVDRPHHPDQLVFDLDPPSYEAFLEARRTALAIRTLLAELQLAGCAKTTGGKGLHVIVPLDGETDYAGVRRFADALGRVLQRRDPTRVTTEFHKEHRGGRLFLDTTRNAYAQHIVAPYGVRARPGAPVATPLAWAEVEDPDLRPELFSLRTVPRRVQSGEPAWVPLQGQSLIEPARRLSLLAEEGS
jgi:bifunctional non-homologous end joining protein LigD